MHRPPSKDRTENQDRYKVIQWLKRCHPRVIFKVSYGDDAHLNPIQAKMQKDLSCGRGWPDIQIFEPRGRFCGLSVEMKEQDATLYKANGLFATKHLEEQADMLEKLKARGWQTVFSKGLEPTILVIEAYLSLPKNPQYA